MCFFWSNVVYCAQPCLALPRLDAVVLDVHTVCLFFNQVRRWKNLCLLEGLYPPTSWSNDVTCSTTRLLRIQRLLQMRQPTDAAVIS